MSVKISYVVTTTRFSKDGFLSFIPVVDVEVFSSYINALRYLVDKKKALKKMGCSFGHRFPKYRTKYGHETLGILNVYHNEGTDSYIITRIPIMDK